MYMSEFQQLICHILINIFHADFNALFFFGVASNRNFEILPRFRSNLLPSSGRNLREHLVSQPMQDEQFRMFSRIHNFTDSLIPTHYYVL